TLHDLATLRKLQGNLGEALCLAERALTIRSQALAEGHPKTAATRELVAHLTQEQAEGEGIAERCPEARTGPGGNEYHEKGGSPPPQEAVTLSPSKGDPLQAFLEACCELHPRARSRSADLWQAYEHWAKAHQERYPLSRGAFIAQLKAHGCRADRTM